jgi:ligand-binding sensor domain-containing protein
MKQLIIVFWAVAAVALHAQAQLSDWQSLTSHNWVRKMVNDGNNIWLTTEGGLIKHNKQTGDNTLLTCTDGLGDNNTIGIAYRDGNVWIGTMNYGISKYNGQYFTNYDMSNSPFLSDQYFEEMAFDTEGNLWVGGLYYIYKYDGKNWEAFTTPNSEWLSFLAFSALKPDDKGAIWFGCEGPTDAPFGRITKDGQIETISIDLSDIYKLDTDKSGNVWICSRYGIARYDENGFTYFNNKNSPIPTNEVYGISADNDGNIWFGCGTKLFKYDGLTFTSYNVPTDKIISDLLIDNGIIWIGTRGDGLFCYANGLFEHISLADNPMTTNTMSFSSVVDSKGNVWIATHESLLKYDADDRWSCLFYKPNAWEHRVLGLAVTNDGCTWAGLWESDTCLVKITERDTTYFTTDNSPLEKNSVNILATDKNNRLWAGTKQGLYLYDGSAWTCYDRSNSPLKSNNVWELAIDQNDRLWCGADNQGLYMFDGTTWTEYNKLNSPMTTNLVRGLAVDSKNKLWFCCGDDSDWREIGQGSGDGLFCFDGSEWKHWNTNNSLLPSNTIMDIAIDKEDHLWMATFGNVGLTSFDGKDNWRIYNTHNSGLGNNDVICLITDNRRDLLWLSLYNSAGISIAKLNSPSSAIHPVYLKPHNSYYYDLQGRKVKQPQHGIYIENGRKTIK